MTPRHTRMALAATVLAGGALCVGLVVNAFNSNLVFFLSPSDVLADQAPDDRPFRLGGLVQAGSVQRQPDGVTVRFVVTDNVNHMPVEYRGVLPDLFKEGKGVVAQGRLAHDGVFRAQEVLAKHDENYMPPEAADALARAQQQKLRAQALATESLPASR
ncbi:MAG: cytochrome c maturation protein CcmE [Burkholderiaceae bacterium]|nr:cytochrome c maturation protein CcmE [Burkholderiaceae bacterium]